MFYRISILAIIAVFLYTGCSDINQVAGGGTETSNGKAVVVVSENSINITGKATYVYGVFDTGYSPATSMGFSDSVPSGSTTAVISSIPAGIYNLFVWDTETGFSDVIQTIPIPSPVPNTFELLMQLPGLVSGYVTDSSGVIPDSAVVEIPGSPMIAYTSAGCRFTLQNVPSANLPLRITAWTVDIITGQDSQVLTNSVEVMSGKETEIHAVLERPVP